MLPEFSIVQARTEGGKELAYPVHKKTRKSMTPLAVVLSRGRIVSKVLVLRRSR
jgi:hypothetical protein